MALSVVIRCDQCGEGEMARISRQDDSPHHVIDMAMLSAGHAGWKCIDGKWWCKRCRMGDAPVSQAEGAGRDV